MRVPQASRMLALGLLLLATTPIRARDDCDAPVADWQPRSAVHALAQRNRWQIDRLKVDDGCYEIRGVDETGRRFKARIDPATLSVVKMKRKDRHDDDHARARRRPSGSDLTGASGILPSNRLFEAGSRPKTVVK